MYRLGVAPRHLPAWRSLGSRAAAAWAWPLCCCPRQHLEPLGSPLPATGRTTSSSSSSRLPCPGPPGVQHQDVCPGQQRSSSRTRQQQPRATALVPSTPSCSRRCLWGPWAAAWGRHAATLCLTAAAARRRRLLPRPQLPLWRRLPTAWQTGAPAHSPGRRPSSSRGCRPIQLPQRCRSTSSRHSWAIRQQRQRRSRARHGRSSNSSSSRLPAPGSP